MATDLAGLLNVLDFGAKGIAHLDPSFDDTPFIRAAVQEALRIEPGNQTTQPVWGLLNKGLHSGIYFPPGVYRITGTIDIDATTYWTPFSIEGAGWNSLLVWDGPAGLADGDRIAFRSQKPSEAARTISVRNLQFRGGPADGDAKNAHTFIQIRNNFVSPIFERLALRAIGFSSAHGAIELVPNPVWDSKANKFFSTINSHRGLVNGCYFFDCQSRCIKIDDCERGGPEGWIISNNGFQGCSDLMLDAKNLGCLEIRNNVHDGLAKPNDWIPSNLYFPRAAGIDLDGAGQVVIENNHFEQIPNSVLAINTARRNAGGCSVVFRNNEVQSCAWDSGPWASYVLRLGQTDDAIIDANQFLQVRAPAFDFDGPSASTGSGALKTRIGRNFVLSTSGQILPENDPSLYHKTGADKIFYT